jgi:hypothetical protein
MITKEENAGLDALETRVLERELPGLVAAFDLPAMRDRLQAGLMGPNSAAEVRRCDLTSAILLDDSVAIRYELLVEDAEGETRTAVVTCRAYPDAERASAYAAERLVPLLEQVRDRDEVSAFAKPATLIESLVMVVYA